jgi:hypothetical protein
VKDDPHLLNLLALPGSVVMEDGFVLVALLFIQVSFKRQIDAVNMAEKSATCSVM